MEIEKKYLLKSVPELKNYECHIIEQAYLCTAPVVRVRQEDQAYYMTYKGGRAAGEIRLGDAANPAVTRGILVRARRECRARARHELPRHAVEHANCPLGI